MRVSVLIFFISFLAHAEEPIGPEVSPSPESVEVVPEPTVPDQQPEPIIGPPPASITAISPELVSRIQSMLESPAGKAYLRLLNNSDFIQSVQDLAQSEKKMVFIYVEIAFFILFILYHSWRSALAKNWFTRALFHMSSFLIFWFISVVVIPTLVLGGPYVNLLKGIRDTFI